MMMLIHRICMAFSGLGKFISVAKEMSVRAAILLETSRGASEVGNCVSVFYSTFGKCVSTHVLSWKRTKFLMLL